MVIVILWIFLCVVAALIASKKGRSGFGFFILSFFLSPLIGIIAALIVQANPTKVEEKVLASGDGKKCPRCAEIIKAEAKVCRFCGADFSADMNAKVQTTRAQQEQRANADRKRVEIERISRHGLLVCRVTDTENSIDLLPGDVIVQYGKTDVRGNVPLFLEESASQSTAQGVDIQIIRDKKLLTLNVRGGRLPLELSQLA